MYTDAELFSLVEGGTDVLSDPRLSANAMFNTALRMAASALAYSERHPESDRAASTFRNNVAIMLREASKIGE